MKEPASIPLSTRNLLWAAAIRFTTSVVAIGALLFGLAGSFRYWNGWLFLAALFGPMTLVFVYLLRKDRALLEKRLKLREREKEQRAYVKLSLLWFLISFSIPGLDYRFGWSHVPVWLVVASVIVMITGYILFIVAMVQNSFASRVIELQANQRVIDTGLYSVVRHPMYMAGIIMYAACPLVLGSYYALMPTMMLPVLLVYRLKNEEKVLQTGLPGYTEYAKRVRFRLVPFIW